MTPSHALEVGQRVLAGLLQGRTQVNLARQARGTQLANQVRYLVLADQQAELPARGRPRRIRRALGGTISESHIRKIIKGLQISAPVLVE